MPRKNVQKVLNELQFTKWYSLEDLKKTPLYHRHLADTGNGVLLREQDGERYVLGGSVYEFHRKSSGLPVSEKDYVDAMGLALALKSPKVLEVLVENTDIGVEREIDGRKITLVPVWNLHYFKRILPQVARKERAGDTEQILYDSFLRLEPEVASKIPRGDFLPHLIAWHRFDQIPGFNVGYTLMQKLTSKEKFLFYNFFGSQPYYGSEEQHFECVQDRKPYQNTNLQELRKIFEKVKKSLEESVGLKKMYVESMQESFDSFEPFMKKNTTSIDDAVTEYTKTKSTSLRNRIVEHFYPVLERIGRTLANKHLRDQSPMDQDDAINLVSMGFMESLEHYDPERGIKLTSFASQRMQGIFFDAIRELSYLARGQVTKVSKVTQAIDDLYEISGRVPSSIEIAAHTGFDHDEVIETLAYAHNNHFVSIYAPSTSQGNDSDELISPYTSLEAQQKDPLRIMIEKEFANDFRRSLHGLNQKSRKSFELYFLEELTMREIGEQLDLSESRVCQLINRDKPLVRGKFRKIFEEYEEKEEELYEKVEEYKSLARQISD